MKMAITHLLILIATIGALQGCRTTVVHETKETKVYGPNVQATESTPTNQPGQTGSVSNPQSAPDLSTDPAWINETRRATGESAAPTNAKSAGQAKLMAKRGAIIEAQRQLIEQILGLRIDSKTSVQDMVTESDTINAQSSGLIKGAYPVSEGHFDSSDGTYTIVMEIKLYDVWQYVKQERTYTKE